MLGHVKLASPARSSPHPHCPATPCSTDRLAEQPQPVVVPAPAACPNPSPCSCPRTSRPRPVSSVHIQLLQSISSFFSPSTPVASSPSWLSTHLTQLCCHTSCSQPAPHCSSISCRTTVSIARQPTLLRQHFDVHLFINLLANQTAHVAEPQTCAAERCSRSLCLPSRSSHSCPLGSRSLLPAVFSQAMKRCAGLLALVFP